MEKADPENSLREFLDIFANFDIFLIRCLDDCSLLLTILMGLLLPAVLETPKSLAVLAFRKKSLCFLNSSTNCMVKLGSFVTTTALGDSLSLRSLTLFLKSNSAGMRTSLNLLQEELAANIDVSSTKSDVLASLCFFHVTAAHNRVSWTQ